MVQSAAWSSLVEVVGRKMELIGDGVVMVMFLVKLTACSQGDETAYDLIKHEEGKNVPLLSTSPLHFTADEQDGRLH
jgi:hypothetical protein